LKYNFLFYKLSFFIRYIYKMPPKKAEAIKVIKGKKKSIDLDPPKFVSRMKIFDEVYDISGRTDQAFVDAQNYVKRAINNLIKTDKKIRPYKNADFLSSKNKRIYVKIMFKSLYSELDKEGKFMRFKTPRGLRTYFVSLFEGDKFDKTLESMIKKFMPGLKKRFIRLSREDDEKAIAINKKADEDTIADMIREFSN